MWLMNDKNEVVLYSDYMLSESIKPREIDYGTDFKNKEWKQLDENFHITFFKTNEFIYTYLYREGFVGFFSSELEDESKLQNITKIKELFDDKKLFNRKDTSKFIHVFNYFFYLTLQAVHKFNPNKIYFDGADLALGNLYSMMVRNRFFNQQLNNNGFEYIGNENIGGRNFFTYQKLKD
jgi:hypothetical protein